MARLSIINDIRSAGRRLILAILAVDILFIAATAYRGGPVWWSRFMGETNMWTRASALQLLASGGTCGLIYSLCRYRAAHGMTSMLKPLVWLAMSIGFVYLACDELFMFHERVERLFHISDAYAVLAYMVVAVALAYPLATDLRKAPRGMSLFAGGIGFTAVSVLIDRATHVRGPLMAVEEVFEFLAGFLFLATFITVLAAVAGQILADALTQSD